MKPKTLQQDGAPTSATAGTRYMVDSLNNDWGNLLVIGATLVGAFLGFDNAQVVCDYIGIKHGIWSSLMVAGLSAAAANLAVQIAYYFITKLMKPFVPDTWLPDEA